MTSFFQRLLPFKELDAEGPRHYKHPGWPERTKEATLSDGSTIRLRPLRRTDGKAWRQIRIANKKQLQPVEPTVSTTWEAAHNSGAWENTFSYLKYSANEGILVPLVIELDDRFVGQLTLGNIQHGTVSECWIGYWVDHAVTGRGVAKSAVALGVDFAFARVGMHRVTATYLPENPASGAVLAASGFVQEGVLRRNLNIDGTWKDHLLMALVCDDFTTTAVDRLRRQGVLR